MSGTNKNKDILAPDGGVSIGDRIVRPGGRIKFNCCWWEHKELVPYVGLEVQVEGNEYWETAVKIREKNFGPQICQIGEGIF